jgi:Pro-kumamolisin, activation domain/Bacterial Ig-like domain (group 3)
MAAAIEGDTPARITLPIDDQVRITLAGSAPLVENAQDNGVAPAALPLRRMILLLRPSAAQSQQLAQFLEDVQNPGAPNYHRWLTPAQYGARFGVDTSDVQTVTAWLEQNGFAVAPPASGGGWIEFSGTAAQMESAFRTSIHSYEAGGVLHVANASDLQIPAAFSPVVAGLVSVNDLEFASAQTTAWPAAAGTELTPQSFAALYNLKPLYDAGYEGAGQSIAVLERSNLRLADVTAYRDRFSLPLGSTRVIVNGTDPGVTAMGPSSDDLEAMLDASWVGAIAPKASIRVIASASTRATDGLDLSIAWAVDHAAAPVIDVGFAACEPHLTSYHQQFYANLWAQAAAEGITVIVASGNNGAAGCNDASGSDRRATGYAVNAIASTAYNTAVGGTSFASIPAVPPELGWSSPDGPQAGGGGMSALYATPPWQAAAGTPQSDPGSTSQHHRYLPDISLAAGGSVSWGMCVAGSCSHGETVQVAGTSAASAAFAGVMALVDEFTHSSQGNAAPVLYALARSGLALRDVTKGGNWVACVGESSDCGAAGIIGYPAGPGYDLATGLGSIDATALVENYAHAADTGTQTAAIALTASSLTPAYGTNYTATATLQSSAQGSTQPSGTVAFTVDSTPAGSALLNAGTISSTASLALVTPTPGNHALGATYSGDTNFAAVTAVPLTIVAQKGKSVTTLVANPDAIVSGTPITLTATITNAVAGVTPALGFTGNVVFYDGTNPVGNQVNVTSNQAVLANVVLDPTVTHTITAEYFGDGNWAASTSAPIVLTLAPAASTTTLTASSTSVLTGTPVTFTAIVSGTNSALPTALPTGTITFLDGTTTIGSAVLAAVADQTAATISTSGLAAGVHNITANYAGNTNFAASVSTAVVVVVLGYSATPNVTSLTLTAGQSGTVVFTVASSLTAPIQFGCQAPAGTDTGCSFAPTSVTGNGQTTLTVTTTASSATMIRGTKPFRLAGAAACLLVLCLPLGRRAHRLLRQSAFLAFTLYAAAIATGCGSANPSAPVATGTPSGEQVMTVITSVSVNNQTTTERQYISVTVQ